MGDILGTTFRRENLPPLHNITVAEDSGYFSFVWSLLSSNTAFCPSLWLLKELHGDWQRLNNWRGEEELWGREKGDAAAQRKSSLGKCQRCFLSEPCPPAWEPLPGQQPVSQPPWGQLPLLLSQHAL